jgi:hypothetical protein
MVAFPHVGQRRGERNHDSDRLRRRELLHFRVSPDPRSARETEIIFGGLDETPEVVLAAIVAAYFLR